MQQGSLRELQVDWSRNKYLVMAHSQQHYNQLRQLFKQQTTDIAFAVRYHHLVKEALKQEIKPGAFINTVQHIWGYFKSQASLEEKHHFHDLLQRFQLKEIVAESVLEYLRSLAIKYSTDYLLNSYFLFAENPLNIKKSE